MLQGEFGAILEWLGARESKEAEKDDNPGACATGLGVSSKLVAGTAPVRNGQSLYRAENACLLVISRL